jgi:DNA-binding CsgD family transcriptional regulator
MARWQALSFWCEDAMNGKTRSWTAREDDQLRSMLAEGKTAAEIAVVLQRTRQSIYARVQRLYRERPLRDLYSLR